MNRVFLVKNTIEKQNRHSEFKSIEEEIRFVTHEIHNIKQRDGRINRFDPKTGIYSANSVAPSADQFLERNIEQGIKPVVAALIRKGYFTYSSCAGHCLSDRRFVGIAFPNKISEIRFLSQTKHLEKIGVVFKRLDSVINQDSRLSQGQLKSTPLGEAGQRFVSRSTETLNFNIQFSCESAGYTFVEMIILEGTDTCDIFSRPISTIKLIITKLFYRDKTTRMVADFIENQLIP